MFERNRLVASLALFLSPALVTAGENRINLSDPVAPGASVVLKDDMSFDKVEVRFDAVNGSELREFKNSSFATFIGTRAEWTCSVGFALAFDKLKKGQVLRISKVEKRNNEGKDEVVVRLHADNSGYWDHYFEWICKPSRPAELTFDDLFKTISPLAVGILPAHNCEQISNPAERATCFNQVAMNQIKIRQATATRPAGDVKGKEAGGAIGGGFLRRQ